MTVANERLYKETAWANDISPRQVEEIVGVVTGFIAQTIRIGSFDSVMIPKFGKFRVKTRLVQFHSTLKPKKDDTTGS